MGFRRSTPATERLEQQSGNHCAHGPPPVVREEIRPDVIAQLEALDDVIFAAIDGDPAALQKSEAAWQQAVSDLGQETVEETRNQYLRHAQGVWESLRRTKAQPPHKIFAAIEIIGLLVNREK
jgi:hypothetical protein